MRILIFFFLLLSSSPATADTVLAALTIRSGTVLTAEHMTLSDMTMPGAATDIAALVGQEARVNLFANRPIRPEDVGPVTVIDRNEVVPLVFQTGGLLITTEARALGSAGIGDTLRVMNLSSRTTVFGVVMPDGSVVVSPNSF